MLSAIVDYGTDYEVYGNILTYVVVLVHIILGLVFFRSAKTNNKGTPQEKIDIGYGWWFIGSGIAYLSYCLDRTWRLVYNERFFPHYEDRLLSSDYYIFAFTFLFFAFIFFL